MRVKNKISYLGEINSILPGQMTEQLAVEVDFKNVTQYTVHSTQQQQHRHMEKLHYLGYRQYVQMQPIFKFIYEMLTRRTVTDVVTHSNVDNILIDTRNVNMVEL